MNRSSRWQPGRLLLGWALGVLTTIGMVTLMAGWYEYRQLSTAPGSGSPGRRVTNTDSACQVDRDGAINVGGFEVVPRQDDPCYLRRPRVRPWQWVDGIREQLGKLAREAGASSAATIASTSTILAAHLGPATNRTVAADSASCGFVPRASA